MTRTQLGIKMNGKKSSAPRHQSDPNAPVKIIHDPLSYFDCLGGEACTREIIKGKYGVCASTL